MLRIQNKPSEVANSRWSHVVFMILAGIGFLLAIDALSCGEEEYTDYHEPPLDEFDREHWAFQAIQSVAVPTPQAATWGRNPIDAFILAELEKSGLQPQPTADRRTLMRRLSFDLTGLPPSPLQIESFIADSSAQAYERLVDQLLESPRYGERWAQHWLDLARFAETDGFEHDKLRSQAWTYRDWVINAFNQDLPYDEFVRLQIAGDEIVPDDSSAAVATHFCLAGPDMPDINLLEERRHAVLNELTSTVGSVFLGLQIGCAQCHDHKYDPISQADFYRLRAIFEPAVSLKKNVSHSVLKESFPFEKTSHLMLRGDFRSPGPEMSPAALRVVSTQNNTFAPLPTEHSAGLRTALADWLVAPENPLTARVIVNRVWQHHFGTGLVETPSDFGVLTFEPTHAELLDWLAVSLIKNNWSLKWLHRKIVTSATYRQRSRLTENATSAERTAWENALSLDPHATMLSRYPRWRLEGEAIRDAMLVASGQINLKMGGPGVCPPLPRELLETLLKNQWTVTKEESEHTRRSIYVFARRNLRYPLFDVFDRPSANSSCSQRGTSTTAPQSLHLLNSAFSLNAAQQMANKIAEEEATHNAQIEQAFLLTLGRLPTPDEFADVQRFLEENATTSTEPLTHLCLSLMNSSEFLFVD